MKKILIVSVDVTNFLKNHYLCPFIVIKRFVSFFLPKNYNNIKFLIFTFYFIIYTYTTIKFFNSHLKQFFSMTYFFTKWRFIAIFLNLFLGFSQATFAQQTTIFTTDCAAAIGSWTYTNGTAANAIQQTGYWLLEQNDVVVSSNINVSSYTSLTIEYKVGTFGTGANNVGTFEYSTNGGTTWSAPSNTQTPTSATLVAAFSPTQLALGTFNTTQFQLRFKHSGAAGKGLRIDDIFLKGTPPACTAPSAVTGETAAPASATAINGSFTANGATGYLVVQSTTGVLSSSPLDGTAYAVNATLGGGTVVASGAANTFSKTSLTACTQYWYHIF
ncbi:MAG: hypothetical protein RI894_2456, partial [Bacteroidota bacterium]